MLWPCQAFDRITVSFGFTTHSQVLVGYYWRRLRQHRVKSRLDSPPFGGQTASEMIAIYCMMQLVSQNMDTLA